jgi:hypothetical protein
MSSYVRNIVVPPKEPSPILLPSDLPLLVEVPLYAVTFCDDGQNFLDHAKNLIMSYEKQLGNGLAKQDYCEEKIDIFRRLCAHNIKMIVNRKRRRIIC